MSEAMGGHCPCLRAGLHDRRGESAKVVELFRDDRMDDIEVEAGVFMHGHVAEADHSLELAGQLGREKFRLLHQGKRVPAFLWKS